MRLHKVRIMKEKVDILHNVSIKNLMSSRPTSQVSQTLVNDLWTPSISLINSFTIVAAFCGTDGNNLLAVMIYHIIQQPRIHLEVRMATSVQMKHAYSVSCRFIQPFLPLSEKDKWFSGSFMQKSLKGKLFLISKSMFSL